ncbi:hypothetical protein DL95DRAFT_527573 [Leptodontidium sp. 2 PMI_412]|nr:hypothetical protein DL95DRAFT_527573 [Leptodontidium sp. 2 PMI_412]
MNASESPTPPPSKSKHRSTRPPRRSPPPPFLLRPSSYAILCLLSFTRNTSSTTLESIFDAYNPPRSPKTSIPKIPREPRISSSILERALLKSGGHPSQQQGVLLANGQDNHGFQCPSRGRDDTRCSADTWIRQKVDTSLHNELQTAFAEGGKQAHKVFKVGGRVSAVKKDAAEAEAEAKLVNF